MRVDQCLTLPFNSSTYLWAPSLLVLALATAAPAASSQAALAQSTRSINTNPPELSLRSGRSVGDNIPPFFVRAITGPLSNQSVCYVCRNGDRPVVMLLMKKLNPQLNELLKGVDKIVDKNRSVGMRSFGVLINDQPAKAAPRLQTLAFDEKIALPLTVATMAIAAPGCQNVHQDAEFTIVLYQRQRVIATYGYRSGELTQERVLTVLQRIRRFASEQN